MLLALLRRVCLIWSVTLVQWSGAVERTRVRDVGLVSGSRVADVLFAVGEVLHVIGHL